MNCAKDKLKESQLDKKNHLVSKSGYSNYSEINYILQVNKTKESYRPLTLIHPLLYVDLVNLLTDKENWGKIKERYEELKKVVGESISCSSMPFDIKEHK